MTGVAGDGQRAPSPFYGHFERGMTPAQAAASDAFRRALLNAPSLARAVIEAVKADRAGAYAMLGFRVRGPDKGGFLQASCAFHDDGHPSAGLGPDGGWICHAGCGKGGYKAAYRLRFSKPDAGWPEIAAFLGISAPTSDAPAEGRRCGRRKSEDQVRPTQMLGRCVEPTDEDRAAHLAQYKLPMPPEALIYQWRGRRWFVLPTYSAGQLRLRWLRMYSRGGEVRAFWPSQSGDRGILGAERLAERPMAPVLIVEGEGDYIAAVAALPDFVVLCTSGANSWKPRWGRVLRGRDVLVGLDDDGAGHAGALAVCRSLEAGRARRVRVVSWRAAGARLGKHPRGLKVDAWDALHDQRPAAARAAVMRSAQSPGKFLRSEWAFGLRIPGHGRIEPEAVSAAAERDRKRAAAASRRAEWALRREAILRRRGASAASLAMLRGLVGALDRPG